MRKSSHHSNALLTHLGEAFRNRRVDIGITQQELAFKTELHRTYITDVESGKRNISMLTYNKLTAALQCALSFPLREIERTMAKDGTSPLYGTKGGLSNESTLLHLNSSFFSDLDTVALELQVKANMSKLQVAVESYWNKHKVFPVNAKELIEAIGASLPINPFSNKGEAPSIGLALDDEAATRDSTSLRPGEIEYSPIDPGKNYIIRAGGASGECLPGQNPGSYYVLSGNLRTNNQP
jgi:transcriptional regulator with XRE-family HTH domain